MSNETKFTPGPWEVLLSALQEVYSSRGEHLFRSVRRDLNGVEYVEQEANARLIAAAPDLYAALEDLLAVVYPAGFELKLQAQMKIGRTALAKARGETT